MEVRIASKAEEDIEHGRSFLETQGLGLGERFLVDVMSTLRYIEQHPRGFQVRSKHYRHAPLASFRFRIIYSMEGA